MRDKLLESTISKLYVYNICCDPNLGADICVMHRVTCACVGCQEQMILTWIPGMLSAYQPQYVTVTGYRILCGTRVLYE